MGERRTNSWVLGAVISIVLIIFAISGMAVGGVYFETGNIFFLILLIPMFLLVAMVLRSLGRG